MQLMLDCVSAPQNYTSREVRGCKAKWILILYVYFVKLYKHSTYDLAVVHARILLLFACALDPYLHFKWDILTRGVVRIASFLPLGNADELVQFQVCGHKIVHASQLQLALWQY